MRQRQSRGLQVKTHKSFDWFVPDFKVTSTG